MARILYFPTRPKVSQALVINLFTDEEIETTVAAVNLFGINCPRVTADTISTLDAESVEFCLRSATVSKLLSSRSRSVAQHILRNINVVSYRQQL
jgi:hypothetical protein